MGRLPNKQKQNPKLIQREMSDGRASLWLEYYLGRSESPSMMMTATMSYMNPGR